MRCPRFLERHGKASETTAGIVLKLQGHKEGASPASQTRSGEGQ